MSAKAVRKGGNQFMVDKICDNCMNRVPADAERCPKCGIRFENTNPGGALPNGWLLGDRYTIGRYIDIDGEGVTYSAIDGNSFQRVVVKEFMPVTLCANRDERGSLVPKAGCEVLFKTIRMDFSELYGALVVMGRSEGLVSVLDVVEENNTVYAVLEKVEGPTLSEYLLRQNRPIEPNRALAILRPVMLGVESLHSANVVHRGISPDNIILESGGTARLAGYATLALRQQGSELKPKLYAGYSAPEQYSASEFEGRFTDIYALGAVLYRMLTNYVPNPADERRMQDTMHSIRNLVADAPNYLSSGVARAMRVHSDERIQTVNELRMALSGEVGSGSAVPPRRREREPEPEEEEEPPVEAGLFGLTKQQTIVGAIALGAVVLILLIILLVSLFSGGKSSSDTSTNISVSSPSDIGIHTVPDFTGLVYQEVIFDRKYIDVFTFADPIEESSETVEKGRIIRQTPPANTEWDGTTEIQLVVSSGTEPMEMPDFVNEVTMAEDARRQLEAKGFTVELVPIANNGQYKNGEVTKTEPVAGTMVSPGVDKITLFVAGEASTIKMIDVRGDSQSKATTTLKGMGISDQQIRIVSVPNDGRYVGGTVESTVPAANSDIIPGSVMVTLRVYDKYQMPDLNTYLGRPASDLTSWLDTRRANFTYDTYTIANDGTRAAGTIASIAGQPSVGAEVTPTVHIVINVYGDAPAPPTPEPPPPAPEPPPPAESASATFFHFGRRPTAATHFSFFEKWVWWKG